MATAEHDTLNLAGNPFVLKLLSSFSAGNERVSPKTLTTPTHTFLVSRSSSTILVYTDKQTDMRIPGVHACVHFLRVRVGLARMCAQPSPP